MAGFVLEAIYNRRIGSGGDAKLSDLITAAHGRARERAFCQFKQRTLLGSPGLLLANARFFAAIQTRYHPWDSDVLRLQ